MTRRLAAILRLALCVVAACSSGSTRQESVAPQAPSTSPPASPSAPTPATPAIAAPEPTPAADAKTLNSASRLLLSASHVEHVSVVRVDTGATLGELTITELAALRDALNAASVHNDMTLSAPRWPVYVELRARGQSVPFIATPHGDSRLRLHPTRPGSSAFAHDDGTRDPSVQEIDVGEATFVALQRVIGTQVEQSKEHALDPENADKLRRWMQ